MSFIACGSDGKSDDNFSDDSDSFEGRVKDSEQIAAQDNPNEGLGGGLNEDAVNDFSEFEGIWLGEANNEYDSMEIDSEGNWTLFLSGEVVDSGYLCYELEWEAIYAYSNLDDSGSRIAIEDAQLYSAAYGYFNYGEGMENLLYEDGSRLTEDDESDSSMMVICQRKSILLLTVMAIGAITSVLPALSLRKWTMVRFLIPRMR